MHYVLETGNVSTSIVEGSVRLADRLLACTDPVQAKSLSAKLSLTDGLIHFVDREAKTLPTGLVHRLTRRLEKRGHTVAVTGQPVQTIKPVVAACLVDRDLRDYQLTAVNDGLAAGRGILWLATNAGKTSVIAAMSGALINQIQAKVLIIVPSGFLLKQLSKEVSMLLGRGVDVQLAGDGEKPTSAPDILVGTYQTLALALNASAPSIIKKFIHTCDAVMVDEAHHATAASIEAILKAADKAIYRYGFTGTVEKRDKAIARVDDPVAIAHRLNMEKYLGPVVARVTNSELIELGVSAKPTIYIVRDRTRFGPEVLTPKQNPPTMKQIDLYGIVFDRAVIQNRKFHKTVALMADHLLQQGKPPFIFSHSIDHLMALSEVLTTVSVKHRVLYGNDSVDKRERVVKKYSDQQDFCVLSSTIFDEGASLPAIKSIIFAGARKSLREALQRLGRGLRKKEDNRISVFDFSMPQSKMLTKQFVTRLATYEGDGLDVEYIDDFAALSQMSF